MTQVYAKTINITGDTYYNNPNITSIDINYCNTINKYGFYNCTNLTNVTNMANGPIDFWASFQYCYNLVEPPVIPDSCVNMGHCFFNCYNLVEPAIIPNNVESLYATFINNHNLVNVPDLSNCINITSLYGTFRNCRSMASFDIDYSNMSECINVSECFNHCNIINVNGMPPYYTNGHFTFRDCLNLKNFNTTFPNTLLDMSLMFHDCQNITTIPNIPDSVINMYGTLQQCYRLTGNIVIESEIIDNAMDCFKNTSLTKNVYIPFNYTNGETSATYNAFINAGYGTDPSNRVNGVCLMDLATYQN